MHVKCLYNCSVDKHQTCASNLTLPAEGGHALVISAEINVMLPQVCAMHINSQR